MYGGSGVTPCLLSEAIRSDVRTRTVRRPSGSTSPISMLRSSPARSTVPAGRRRPGFTSACQLPLSPSGSSSSTSTWPPVGLRRSSRAGSTRVRLTTRTSSASRRSGRSATRRCCTAPLGSVATSRRAASRGSTGVWATAPAGRSYSKELIMSAFEARRRASASRDGAQLLQEAQRVPDLPRLGDLAALHAVDGDGVDADLLARRRDSVDLADVCATAGPPHDDPVVGREDFLDTPVPVHPGLLHLHDVRHSLRSRAGRHLRIVHDVRFGEELRCELVLALVVHLLVEAADNCFV